MLWVWAGLAEVVGLGDGLGVRLADCDVLADCERLALPMRDSRVLNKVPRLGICTAESSLAVTTAVELPQGEPVGRADVASAEAITRPDTMNEPAARQTVIRPARRIPTGTVALRSSGRPRPVLPSDVRC